VDSRRIAKGAELSTAAVVACDEPTDAVGSSGRTKDFILCNLGQLGQQVFVDLLSAIDVQLAQQVGVDLVARSGLAGTRLRRMSARSASLTGLGR
jgi:hypothetical protein